MRLYDRYGSNDKTRRSRGLAPTMGELVVRLAWATCVEEENALPENMAVVPTEDHALFYDHNDATLCTTYSGRATV